MLTSFIKDTKTANEINKKREEASNLFGLGLVSLIAACSSDDLNAGAGNDEIPIDDDTTTMDDDTTTIDDDVVDTPDPDPLPFKALTASEVSVAESGLMATAGGDTNSFIVELSDSTGAIKTLNFAKGKLDTDNAAKIYQLTDAEDQYDLVISSPRIDKVAGADYQKGKIFIYWDAANIVDETSLRLEITGTKADDLIGINAPEFLQIGGKDDNYDMVIRAQGVDTPAANAGAMYILWDVADYHNTDTASLNHAITLDSSATGATFGSLAIYGVRHFDHIGVRAPEFLQIGGKDDNYDMVIRESDADKSGDGARNEEGAMYILWDIADYHNTDTASLRHTINLDSNVTGEATGATSGSLTIYGAQIKDQIGIYAPDFLQIGGVAGDNKLDMVIRSEVVDTPAADAGAMYILWDIADYHNTATVNHTITLDASVTGATFGSLTIYGEKPSDVIGNYAPEFLQLGGKDDNHDMIIRGRYVDQFGAGGTAHTNEGAIFILWDVEDYHNTATVNHTITLDSSATGATSGSLAIYGARQYDHIGDSAPEFLQIGGKDDNYDMVIREKDVNKSGNGAKTYEGAIYILWDVEDYYSTDPASLHHTINLDSNVTGIGEATGATSGSLTIYGGKPSDVIGANAPEFLHIGGKDDNYDMVIGSAGVDKFGAGGETNEGAIYVLWDVEDYYSTDPASLNQTINLDASATGATSGSLAIHGARNYDYVGVLEPDFLQIGGKDDNYDMVIRSNNADKVGISNDEGAIYVLWDVEDYYSTDPADANKVIDLAVAASATSGLLTIYGKATGENLGSDANNVLYGSDNDGNKILTNIDGDAAGTKDIAFRDKDYTYILFGNKVAATGGDTEVDSKTIDLAKVVIALDENNADGNFFSYDFDESTPYTVTARVGYRFASGTGSDGDEGYTTLAEVQEAYDLVNPSSLSDKDADLGVWDIA